MKIVTRTNAIRNLQSFIGQDLAELAKQFDIQPFKDGKQNKGWKGLLLERLAGLQNNNSRAPNGLSFELKSVAFQEKKGIIMPRETMAITMLNPHELVAHDFFKSHCWAKLKSIVFCAVEWTGSNAASAKLLKVANLDFAEDDELILEIKADYDFIRNKLITEGFVALTGKDGKWIQARTKGPGHGSVSRAFYAKKGLVKKIFEIADL
ncbi:MAG: MutH/Sau3AI family endonuclease [Patescibacteria group bacterium]